MRIRQALTMAHWQASWFSLHVITHLVILLHSKRLQWKEKVREKKIHQIDGEWRRHKENQFAKRILNENVQWMLIDWSISSTQIAEWSKHLILDLLKEAKRWLMLVYIIAAMRVCWLRAIKKITFMCRKQTVKWEK